MRYIYEDSSFSLGLPVDLVIFPLCFLHSLVQGFWFLTEVFVLQKKVLVQHLCLGKTPPTITMIRSLDQPTDGDHMVLLLFALTVSEWLKSET